MRYFVGVLVGGMFLATSAFSGGMANDLAGSEWGFAESDGRFVKFEAEGKVSGYGGCNRFFGSYSSTQLNELSFSEIGLTKMACPEQMMESETELFSILKMTASYKREGNQLSLHDKDSVLLALLVRKDWD